MSKLLNCLKNKDCSYVPIWFMRQAGRYLPEFRKIRSQNPDFIKLCLNSNLASEITLQPMKKFNLDAAIIFSDILIIPHALKQNIKFEKGGPRCTNFNLDEFLNTTKNEFLETLKPVYEAIKKTKDSLDKKKSLIAFVGAPWTLLIYLYNLKSKGENITKLNIENKKEKRLVLDKLNDFLKLHIIKQKESGADVVQIFDSWAGLLNNEDLEEFCYQPNKKLVSFCKDNSIPSICFPKGLKDKYKIFSEKVKPNAINIDYDIDPEWAKKNLTNLCIQGGMKPELLLKDEKLVLDETEKYLEIFKNIPYIFNLGHGILPKTDPEIIKKIVNKIKAVRK